ncbi:MAG: flagellar basal-body rod protein FlgF [Myxococcota bacterium]
MSTGIWSAASGAVAQSASLDTAANNVANASTPGFRAETAIFRQTLVDAISQNTSTRSQRFAVTRTTSPDMRQGQILHTGRDLDVAITEERGFFAVATPNGERFTRAGSFRVSVDGTLVTADGHTVLGPSRRPVQVSPTATSLQVGPDGAISAAGEPTGATVGVFTFGNLNALEKEGEILFRPRPEAGPPRIHDGKLESRALEQSNANAVSSMTTLVNASRQFEMVAKVIEAFSQIERRAATDIMKR